MVQSAATVYHSNIGFHVCWPFLDFHLEDDEATKPCAPRVGSHVASAFPSGGLRNNRVGKSLCACAWVSVLLLSFSAIKSVQRPLHILFASSVSISRPSSTEISHTYRSFALRPFVSARMLSAT